MYCICISCYNAPLERLRIIGQPQNIILRNIRATIVLGGSQLTRCIPLSKREAKIKNQAGFFVFDKFSLQVNLGDESGGVVTSLLNILFLNMSQVNSTMRPFFYRTDRGQNLFFFCPILFLPYNSAVFHNFARQFALIQYPRRQSTRFLCTTNYSIEL